MKIKNSRSLGPKEFLQALDRITLISKLLIYSGNLQLLIGFASLVLIGLMGWKVDFTALGKVFNLYQLLPSLLMLNGGGLVSIAAISIYCDEKKFL